MQQSNTLILKTAKNTKPVFATMIQFMFVRPNLIVAKFVFIPLSFNSFTIMGKPSEKTSGNIKKRSVLTH